MQISDEMRKLMQAAKRVRERRKAEEEARLKQQPTPKPAPKVPDA